MGAELFDIAIIGGGIAGLGIAREAARRGYKTVLYEKNRLCCATSNSSLRIIHGGLRYLQTLDLPRIVISIRDQHRLLREFPEQVVSLPCLFPLKASGFKSRFPLTAASLVYRGIYASVAGVSGNARVISAKEANDQVPVLKPQLSRGAFLWHDALLVKPDALTEALAAQARSAGATLLEDTEVVQLDASVNPVRIDPMKHLARFVVDASGPWLGRTVHGEKLHHPTGWCKAFNLILKRKLSTVAFGVHAALGRIFFFVPRVDQTVVGTWYVPFRGDPDRPAADEKEVRDFLDAINEAAPELQIGFNDLLLVESGILPMRGMNQAGPVLYGKHILEKRGPLISVLSTKYTTFQSQAEDVMRLVQGRS